MADPTARALRLLSLLQTHRHWSGAELAHRLGVSQRTVRRDVERLRDLGYPVDASPGVDGGYQLAAGAHLPPLLVDDDEAVALAVGLRAAAGSAVAGIEETTVRVMAKLEQMLPHHVRRRVEALNANVDVLAWRPTDAVSPAHLGLLAQSCRDREEVRFEYTRRDGDVARRLVQPHQLVTVGHRWYLVAWDVRRDDWRTFRVDRIAEPALAGARFDQRVLPADSGAAFVAESLRSTPVRHEATVVVTGSDDAVEALRRRLGADHTAHGDGTHRLVLGSDSEGWLAAMIAIAATDHDVTVEAAPSGAMDRLRMAAERLARATRT